MFVIILWLIKIFLLNFNNRIIYQNNILTAVPWVKDAMGSSVVMDDFCYLKKSHCKVRTNSLPVHIPEEF